MGNNIMRGQILAEQREIIKQNPEFVYEVDPSFVDNPNLGQFSTINGAIDYVKDHKPDYPAKATIYVYPGIYTESITYANYRIVLVGTAATSYYNKGVILYNTGLTADDYPIKYTGSGTLNLVNMTVEVDSGGKFGELCNIVADNSSFLNGHFIEYSGLGSRVGEFHRCTFEGDAFKLTGSAERRFIALRDCDLYGGSLEFKSTSSESKAVKFDRTLCASDVEIAGAWSVNSQKSEMYGTGKFVLDTTADVIFDGVLLPNGVHFKSNPAGEKRFIGCNFINLTIASTHHDISADVAVTDVDYYGNSQQNGICKCIQIKSPEKHVGAHKDRYYDLQSAISSIVNGGTVRIWENLIDLPEITLPNANVDLSIDGQKKYSLTFLDDIVEVGADRKVSFVDMVKVDGGNIQLNGTNAEVGFESCQYVNGYLTLTLGAFAILYKSSLFGSTGRKAVNFDNVNTIFVIGYSRVQGSSGNEAIIFNVDADNKLKAKYSSIIHGSGGANAPLTYAGAGKVDFQMYTCGLNATWNPASLNNTIGSANNTFDPGITF